MRLTLAFVAALAVLLVMPPAAGGAAPPGPLPCPAEFGGPDSDSWFVVYCPIPWPTKR